MESQPEPGPPPPARVLRRARVLAALAHRGLIEQDRERARAHAVLGRIRGWLSNERLDAELEPGERALFAADPGTLAVDATLACVRRFEGAAVLAWALSLAPLPAHDRVADVAALSRALAIGQPLPHELAAPSLRAPRSLDRMRERLFAVHWRVVEQSIRPGTIDLATFARTAWFGPLELDSSMLIEGDLAIEGAPIARAAPDAVRRVTAIAIERHQAINWVAGDDPVYSEVDVSI